MRGLRDPDLMDSARNARMTCRDVLFVVHPGSAYGSADEAYGPEKAQEARIRLAETLDSWRGGIVVIDGFLSPELKDRPYNALGRSLTSAVRRARNSYRVVMRLKGCDTSETKNQTVATHEAVRTFALNGTDRIQVTGAWYDPSDAHGCVNDVIRALRTHDIEATVNASVLDMDLARDFIPTL